ncbi:hypothetical protein HK098_005869 [Nowakowskiella sp. JEL0407]|nr:hypothetical protein HK098_005869 [Nowakowskiella sp. JEL0407]
MSLQKIAEDTLSDTLSISSTNNKGIITISQKNSANSNNYLMKKLEMVKRFEPLLGVDGERLRKSRKDKIDDIYSLNPEPLSNFLNRCKSHIEMLTNTITSDQSQLTTQVSKLDTFSSTVTSNVAEKLARARNCDELLAQVPVEANLESVKNTLSRTEDIAKRLLEHKIEPRTGIKYLFAKSSVVDFTNFVSLESDEGKKKYPMLHELMKGE